MIAVSSTSFAKSEGLRHKLEESFSSSQVKIKYVDPFHELEGNDLRLFLGNATMAIVGKEPIDERLVASLPRLKAISKYGVGIDNIDFAACKNHGVIVKYKSGVNASFAAEHTLGMMISLLRNIGMTHHLLSQGRWHKDGGVSLIGKTVGIIGCGNIGSLVAKTLRESFGCQILIRDVLDKGEFARDIGAEIVNEDSVFKLSDVISLHVPLTDKTLKMVSRERLQIMKKSSYLINTCRGEVVDQEALKQALIRGEIAGAALDVYENEPVLDEELLSIPNLLKTPHIAGNAVESVLAMGEAAIEGLLEAYQRT